MKGYKVLLVDGDPQSNTTDSLLDDEFQDEDLTLNNLLLDKTIPTKKAIYKTSEDLDLIPATLDLADTELSITLDTSDDVSKKLFKILRQVQDDYDYCIIDCSPRLGALTTNIIIASNYVIIPIKPERYAVKGLGITMRNMIKVKGNFELDLDYKIVFSCVSRNKAETAIINQVTEAVGKDYAFKTRIRFQSSPITTASSEKEMVISDNKGVSQDLRDFVSEVLEVLEG